MQETNHTQRWYDYFRHTCVAVGYHIVQAKFNLKSFAFRSFLAILGILIGTASVVTLVMSGKLATSAALAEFEKLGTGLLSASIYQSREAPTQQTSHGLELQDIRSMQQEIPELEIVAPYTRFGGKVVYDGHVLEGQAIGAEQHLAEISNLTMQRGRFISFVDGHQPVCAIGQGIYQQLRTYLPGQSVLGKQLLLDNYYCTIVGVGDQWVNNFFIGEDLNRTVFVPINFSLAMQSNAAINQFIARLKDNANTDHLTDKVKHYVKQIAPGMEVYVQDAEQIIGSMKKQDKIFTLLLWLIGSISLLVGGIGIMNIMLMSVAERKREIGIRMAVGAKRKDILLLFLVEAIMLSLIGATLGIVIGIVITATIAFFAKWAFSVFFTPIVVALLIAVSTGIFFGFYPAYKASRLQPIETLRTE